MIRLKLCEELLEKGSDARKGGKKGKEKMRRMDSSYSDDRATIGRDS